MLKPMLACAAMAALAVPVLAQEAAPSLPPCSAKVKDGCQQTPAQEKRAMTGEQAMKANRPAKWDTPAAPAAAAKPKK